MTTRTNVIISLVKVKPRSHRFGWGDVGLSICCRSRLRPPKRFEAVKNRDADELFSPEQGFRAFLIVVARR
jgi:hypothetical protein